MKLSYLLPTALLAGVALSATVTQPPCTTAAASPTPTGYHCDDQGSLSSPTPLATTTSSSQTACRDSCLSNKACISFSYNTAKKQCITSTKSLVAQGFKKSTTSGVYYYNRNCYTITCPTCPTSQSYCSSSKKCTNLQTDIANCGACGNACNANQYCSGGKCLCTPSPKFQLQVQNSGLCNDNGNYPVLVNTSRPALGYSVSSKAPASSSPTFYLTYFNGDGFCSVSGPLTLTKAGAADQTGYTTSSDGHLVHFVATNGQPTPGDSVGNCRVDFRDNSLDCSSNGSQGFWFTCCDTWRFGTDEDIAAFNSTSKRCQKMDMIAQYTVN